MIYENPTGFVWEKRDAELKRSCHPSACQAGLPAPAPRLQALPTQPEAAWHQAQGGQSRATLTVTAPVQSSALMGHHCRSSKGPVGATVGSAGRRGCQSWLPGWGPAGISTVWGPVSMWGCTGQPGCSSHLSLSLATAGPLPPALFVSQP